MTPAHVRLLVGFGHDVAKYCIRAETANFGVQELNVLESKDKVPVMELYGAGYMKGTYIPRCIAASLSCLKVVTNILPGVMLTARYVLSDGEWYAVSGTCPPSPG